MFGMDIEDLTLGKFIWKGLGPFLAILGFWAFMGYGIYYGVASFTNPDVNVNHKIIHRVDRMEASLNSLDKKTIIVKHNNKSDTVLLKDVGQIIELQPEVSLNKDMYWVAIGASIMWLLLTLLVFVLVKNSIREYQKIKLLGSIKRSS
jgi:hypothetical protein